MRTGAGPCVGRAGRRAPRPGGGKAPRRAAGIGVVARGAGGAFRGGPGTFGAAPAAVAAGARGVAAHAVAKGISPSGRSKERLEQSAKESRRVHTSGTDLIAALLEAEAGAARGKGAPPDDGPAGAGAGGARGLAVSRVDELTPEFFSVADAYMALARREGNADVIAQLENILKIAWEVKNDTLRGELKLLNQLINAKRSSERAALLKKNAALLHSDDGFFFRTLEQFAVDVEKKPEMRPGSGDKMKMMVKLRTIKREAKRAAADGGSFDLV